MSTAYAYAEPQQAPRRDARPRHIEIVTTRAQRRSRPRSFYAVVAVTSVFALLIAQLLLSILLSDGAYQIAALQGEQKQLARTEQALNESLDLLASPQSLALRAESLGMVLDTNAPVLLRLSDGLVSGIPTPAAGAAGAIGADGAQVANALLTPPTMDPLANGTESTSDGAPPASTSNASVPSNGGGPLPSPQTR